MGGKPRRVMVAGRKTPVGLERSGTRTLLLDAAEQLMREEGYAAVSTRRLGAVANVKPQLVNYYFPAMDDLFLALFRRRSERNLEAAREALKSDQPLRVLWRRNRDPSDATIRAEFMALAHHRKELRVEIAGFTDQIRHLQHEAVVRYFQQRGVQPQLDARVMTVLMAAVGMLLAREEELGVSFAHAETEAAVEAILADLEQGLTPQPPS